MTPPDPAVSLNWTYNSLAEVALIRQNRTCKTGLQLAIFEIQANRGCPKGAKLSNLQNACKDNFLGLKMTPPDQAVTFNWTKLTS